MGCGCAKTAGTVRRVGGEAPVNPFGGRARAARRVDGHCCEACAVGAPCGSRVEVNAGYNWHLAPDETREVVIRAAGDVGEDRAAGDPPSCERRSGESVAAYRTRCGLEATGMDAELWGTMNATERRQYLRDVAQTARLQTAEEQRIIRQAISGGFDTLREVIRTVRDIRIQEIRSGAAVQIASIRGLTQQELDFLERWDTNTTTTTPPPEVIPSTRDSMSSSPVATIGIAAIAAKLLGIW